MGDINALEFLAVPLAYLVGSISFSYILARLVVGTDLREEGDGHVSATAVYRLLGFRYFVLAIILDVGKGTLAVFLAGLISSHESVILASGFAAVAGHCWPLYTGLKGGLGATVIYGVLAFVAIVPVLIAAITGGIVFFITRRSTLGTVIIIVLLSLVLFLFGENWTMIAYPYSLLLLQFLKRWQIRGKNGGSRYRMDLNRDLDCK